MQRSSLQQPVESSCSRFAPFENGKTWPPLLIRFLAGQRLKILDGDRSASRIQHEEMLEIHRQTGKMIENEQDRSGRELNMSDWPVLPSSPSPDSCLDAFVRRISDRSRRGDYATNFHERTGSPIGWPGTEGPNEALSHSPFFGSRIQSSIQSTMTGASIIRQPSQIPGCW